jgi:threonine dehydrogenase-like Zn-dependent dehydrogenase
MAARNLGLATIDENAGEAWRICKERWHEGGSERGVDLVFQCRANAESLQNALRSLRPQGTVIDLAFYQGGADAVRLGEEFHHNGLAIRCAQINRVPRGLAHRWQRQHLAAATIDLLRAYGDLIRNHMITDVVPFNASPALFEDLTMRRRNIIQAVFKVFDERSF